jgi:flagellar biogenesis protein FliO
MDMDALQEIAAVAAVLGLLGAVLWLLRRRGIAGILPLGKPHGRRLECVERLALSPHHALHLIRLGDRGLLVTSSPGACALIARFPWRELESSREAAR